MTDSEIFWRMLFGSNPQFSPQMDKVRPLELAQLRKLPTSLTTEHTPESVEVLSRLYFLSEDRPADMESGSRNYLLVSARIRELLEQNGARSLQFVEVTRVSNYGVEPRWLVLSLTPPIDVIDGLSEPYPFEKADRKTQVSIKRSAICGPIFGIRGQSDSHPGGTTVENFCTDEFARACRRLRLQQTWFACGDHWYPENSRVHVTYRTID